jgi:hypothetical protein
MSIPLDRLYQYIEHISNKIYGNVVIYRFNPHGSKKSIDLTPLRDYETVFQNINPSIVCYDQEPLDYARYQHHTIIDFPGDQKFKDIILKNNLKLPHCNLKLNPYNIYDRFLLLHSEKQSHNVDLYLNDQFIPIYYWSHAIIALDWFRFSKYLEQKKQVQKTFLIYNRAWAGTREYRLKFSELILQLGLENNCQMSINPVEPELGIHYDQHTFNNLKWQPTHVLENYFPINTALSHYSADFDIKDYESTDIEIVLETLFDDSRLHLTEKSLRPIACAQPFILAGTQGSLEYLRGYGFKTFADIWNEQYDSIEDSEERLNAIADLMKQITNWAPWVRERKMAEAQAIANYNRQRFFSQEFFNQINTELTSNLTTGLNLLETTNTSKQCLDWKTYLRQYPDYLESHKNSNYVESAKITTDKANYYYQRSLITIQNNS